MSVSFVWYPAATYFPARGSHSAARSFSVADAPRTPCLTGSPVRFIVHRTRSQSIPSPALGCFTWPGKYLLIKDQRKTPCAAWCSSLVSGGYLFFRAVTSQVSSAYKGLTSVFGMRTGGPLSLSPPKWLNVSNAHSQLHKLEIGFHSNLKCVLNFVV